MSHLTHITIPIELYQDKNLCEVKRAVLSLALAFGDTGLRIPDGELAKLFGKSRQWLNKIIGELKTGNYIKIEKSQSKYRVIYYQENATVNKVLLSRKVDSKKDATVKDNCSTVNPHLTTSQGNLTHNITKELKEEGVAYSDGGFLDYWNSRGNLPKVVTFTANRQKKLKARMSEKLFAEHWRQIIDKISASDFCTGGNNRGWRVDVDWLLKNSENYTKVFEGKYDNRDGGNQPADGNGKDRPLTPERENAILDQLCSRNPTDAELVEVYGEGALA